MWWVALAVAILTMLRNEKEKAEDPGGRRGGESLEAAIRRHARHARLPEREFLAMAQVESSLRHLPPGQDGGSLTYYPMGMKVVAGQTVWPEGTPEQIQTELKDLDGHLALAAKYLKRGLSHYNAEDPLLRVWWVNPAAARKMAKGGAAPRWTKRSVERWQQARERWTSVS